MSAHSENMENVISMQKFMEEKNRKFVQSLCHIKKIYLIDGTKAQMDYHLNQRLVELNVTERADQLVFIKSIRNGVLLYCSMINRDRLTMREAGIIIDILLMAIAAKKDDKHPTPFVLEKRDIVTASENWNTLFLGKI